MIHNIADITGNGTALPLVAGGVRTPANWVLIVAPAANASSVRFGDSTTSSTSGVVIPKGTSLLTPATSNAESLDLSQLYVLVANSDTVSVIYGKT